MGNVTATTDHPRTGTHGLREIGGSTYPQVFGALGGGDVCVNVWYWEEMSHTTNFMALLRLWDPGNATYPIHCIGTGIWTGTSQTNYSYHTDGFRYTATALPRTPGWRHLSIAAGPASCELRVDGTPVATLPVLDEALINRFSVEGYQGGTGYFDDAYVRSYATPEPTVLVGAAGAPNSVAMDATAVVALTTANPCAVAVPVKIARTDATPVRGYSVTFELSPELALCGDAESSILEGAYLDGFGTGSQFEVTANPDGTYTIDDVILGSPCGTTEAEGVLFTVDLTHAVAEGTGTVSILAVELRGCDNEPLAVDPGAAAAITIDTVAPLPVGDLAAVPSVAGSGPGRTVDLDIGWTPSTSPDAGQVAVYRKGFDYYPEYDDGGGTVPVLDPAATPAQAEAAGWTLVDVVTGAAATDRQATRDVWSYAAFTIDLLGNVSVPSALSAGRPNYILGDVSDGLVVEGEPLPGDGDNKLDTVDMSLLGTYYGQTIGLDHVANRLDIGPLVGDPLLGRPATDNEIEFEDLILFGINYGQSGLLLKQVPLQFATPAPADRNEPGRGGGRAARRRRGVPGAPGDERRRHDPGPERAPDLGRGRGRVSAGAGRRAVGGPGRDGPRPVAGARDRGHRPDGRARARHRGPGRGGDGHLPGPGDAAIRPSAWARSARGRPPTRSSSWTARCWPASRHRRWCRWSRPCTGRRPTRSTRRRPWPTTSPWAAG